MSESKPPSDPERGERAAEPTLPADAPSSPPGSDDIGTANTLLGSAATVAATEGLWPALGPSFANVGGSLDGGSGPLGDEGLTDEHPGRYQIGHELGVGGIGLVYVAVDTHLGREVALKELHSGATAGSAPSRFGDGTSTSRSPMELRFVNEARVTGQLEHPGIVPIYELGRRADGAIYYSMRLVRGRTLGDALAERDLRGRLDLLPNFVELCQAVAYAHSHGVVHRDLKPDNVMLGDYGETVVLDWGLAKVRGQRDVQSRALKDELEQLKNASPVETVAGLPIGTPSYMPPEQALGELDEIDERSDVYALGAVLYQLLTGEPPFTGNTALEVVRRVVRDDPVPPAQHEAACPPELAAIAMRGLAKEKEPRYADAAELAKDVRAFLTGGLVRAHQYGWATLTRRWLRRHRLLFLVAILVVAVFAGAWVIRGDTLAQQEAAARARAEQHQRQRAVAELDGIIDQAVQGSLQPRWLDALAFKVIRMVDPVTQPALEERLIAALAHDSASVRRLAARSLGGLGSKRAVVPLTERLAKNVEAAEEVTVEVINALGVIGDARAEKAVREARWRKGQFSRLAHHTELAHRMIPMQPVPPEGLSAAAWSDRGRALLNRNDIDGALAAFGRAIERDPNLQKAYNNRAIIRSRLADYEGALQDYDKTLELDPSAYRSVHNRATVKRWLGDYEGALEDHDRAIATGKMTGLALRSRGITLRYMGDFDGAMALYQRAAELEPNDARVLFGIGVTRMWQQDWDGAIGAYTKALAQNPEYGAALEWRGICHQATGGYDAALGDYERAIDLEPSRDLSRRGRASLRLRAGDRDGAKADLDLCVRARCPGAATQQGLRLAQRGIIYHAELGELEAALADVERAAATTRNADQQVQYRILALALGLRLGTAATSEGALSGLPYRHPKLWYSRLARVLRGEERYEELQQVTFEATARCYLLLTAGIRTELGGDGAGALELYRAASEVPRPISLPCVMARTSARALASE